MSISIAFIVPIVTFSVGVLVGMAVMCLLAVTKERDEWASSLPPMSGLWSV